MKVKGFILICFICMINCGCRENMKLNYNYYNSFSNKAYEYEIDFNNSQAYINFIDDAGNKRQIKFHNVDLLKAVYKDFKAMEVLKPEIELDDYENSFTLNIEDKQFSIVFVDDSFTEVSPSSYKYDSLLKLHANVLQLLY